MADRTISELVADLRSTADLTLAGLILDRLAELGDPRYAELDRAVGKLLCKADRRAHELERMMEGEWFDLIEHAEARDRIAGKLWQKFVRRVEEIFWREFMATDPNPFAPMEAMAIATKRLDMQGVWAREDDDDDEDDDEDNP